MSGASEDVIEGSMFDVGTRREPKMEMPGVSVRDFVGCGSEEDAGVKVHSTCQSAEIRAR
jgi:hypothetical protein